MWGARNVEEMAEILRDAYAVKFNYHSGGPGYVGDYFIIQGDAIGYALELIRDKAGKVVLIDRRDL